MSIDRRRFFLWTLAGLAQAGPLAAGSPGGEKGADDHAACLVDTTLCIGCRKCEEACNRANELPAPETPFSDRTVFRGERRPTDSAFTVVNGYPGAPSPDQPLGEETYAKVQCMHCLDPACVSACIVGAMTKRDDGPVLYDRGICIGCRYCLIACPFEIPAYEYFDPVTPRVRKCEFCVTTARGPEVDPACAAACPVEAIVFGKRGGLLHLARERIEQRPDRYLPHIYGELEMGGTSWLYLAGRPEEEIGLLDLPDEAPARLAESIQHGIFQYAAIPIAVYGALGALMWRSHRREEKRAPAGDPPEQTGEGEER